MVYKNHDDKKVIFFIIFLIVALSTIFCLLFINIFLNKELLNRHVTRIGICLISILVFSTFTYLYMKKIDDDGLLGQIKAWSFGTAIVSGFISIIFIILFIIRYTGLENLNKFNTYLAKTSFLFWGLTFLLGNFLIGDSHSHTSIQANKTIMYYDDNSFYRIILVIIGLSLLKCGTM